LPQVGEPVKASPGVHADQPAELPFSLAALSPSSKECWRLRCEIQWHRTLTRKSRKPLYPIPPNKEVLEVIHRHPVSFAPVSLRLKVTCQLQKLLGGRMVRKILKRSDGFALWTHCYKGHFCTNEGFSCLPHSLGCVSLLSAPRRSGQRDRRR
jgi:hypothetical protein